jgi:hypothetical protein
MAKEKMVVGVNADQAYWYNWGKVNLGSRSPGKTRQVHTMIRTWSGRPSACNLDWHSLTNWLVNALEGLALDCQLDPDVSLATFCHTSKSYSIMVRSSKHTWLGI